MKVLDNRRNEENRVCFNDLLVGTVYADNSNNICIKTSYAEDGEQNCIYLSEGKWRLETEDEDELVTVLNAKLIIEN